MSKVCFTICLLLVLLLPATAGQSAGTCGLGSPAFCEQFDVAHPQLDRAGTLDSVVWGVSRAGSMNNNGQGQFENWSAATQTVCGFLVVVAPETDTTICNGHLVETVNDNGGDTIWAAYPRQPFDIAGRTGKVTFDVGADSQGPHAAWPAFVYTDQPVPAPYGNAAGIADHARNSIGFTLANAGPCTGVDAMYMTTNRVYSTVAFSQDGCVQEPTAAQVAAGQINHFEVDLNATSIVVFGTDPGSTITHQIAHAAGISVPLTRGLVWIEDVHYNASKYDSQRNHTFVWDNVGFDGPILPRDLGFDVLDSRTATGVGLDGLPTANLGWYLRSPGNPPLSLKTVPSMTAANISAATAALLEFTWFPYTPQTLTYTLNGHAPHDIPWPYPSSESLFVSNTLAAPIALSELQAGANTITLSTTASDGVILANFDIILVGAGMVNDGGVPTATPTSIPTSTTVPTSTSTPTVIPTDTPTATPTATSTPVVAETCTVLATLNGVEQRFSRPLSYCTDL